MRIELQHINIQASPLRFRARLTYVRHHPYKVSLDIVFEYEHVKRLVRCPSDGREIDWHDLLIPFAFKHHMRHLCDICFGEILLLFKRSWSMVQCVHLDLDPDVVRTVAVLQRFRAEILDHFQRLQRSLRTLVEWTESQLGSCPKVSREVMGRMEVQPTSFIYQNILQQLESVIGRRQLLFQILLQLLQRSIFIGYKRRRTILTLDTTT